MSAREAFSEKTPLPPAVMETVAWLDAKDRYIKELEALVWRAYEVASVDGKWLEEARRVMGK